MNEGEIPLLDLRPEIAAIRSELMMAIERVVRSGRFVLGPEVEALEREVAAFLGCAHAVGVNSCTDALSIALRALGIGPGDEVLVPAFTFVATASAVLREGARPVFCDIDPLTYGLDARDAARRITSLTKAVVAVHLFGLAADLDAVASLGLPVIEDAAQAFGATYRGRRVGTIGVAGGLSFFPTKNLGAFGDAGMVVTNDPAVADLARSLRDHGQRERYRSEMAGFNSRLDELQAAILRVKLSRVEQRTEARRRAAARYGELLAGQPGVVLPQDTPVGRHVYHLYTIRIEGGRRDRVREHLWARGIASQVYYPVPLHRLPMSGGSQELPQAERAAREVLSLPLWPDIHAGVQERVAAAVRSALG